VCGDTPSLVYFQFDDEFLLKSSILNISGIGILTPVGISNIYALLLYLNNDNY